MIIAFKWPKLASDHDSIAIATRRTMTRVRSLLPIKAVGVDVGILRVVGPIVDDLRIKLILLRVIIAPISRYRSITIYAELNLSGLGDGRLQALIKYILRWWAV